MPSITIPREFFQKERNTVYSEWKFAFWRELIQNSVDGQATRIDILMEAVNDDTLGEYIKVVFADNGHGMPRDVLTNVYFSLGKSTKDKGSSIGGFGRARILTCFSMLYYKIWTQDNFVEGNGASYELTALDPAENGCRLEIGVDGASEHSLIDGLKTYIKCSDLKTKITLNGAEMNSISLPLGEHVRDLSLPGENSPFARVYVNKGDMDYYVLVRVNGTLMYKEYVNAPHRVTIELDPTRSREILTASRDSLHDKFKTVVASYRDELASNTKRATKNTLSRVRVKTPGAGMTTTKAPEHFPREGSDILESHLVRLDGVGSNDYLGSDSMDQMHQAVKQMDYLDMGPAARENLSKLLTQVPELVESFSPLPSVVFMRNTADEKIIAASEKYRPANWKYRVVKGRVVWVEGEEQVRLLMLWKQMCEEAVKALIASGRTYDVTWSVGWVFEEGVGAVADKDQDGHHFLLNPLNDEAKARFRLRDAGSLKRMMSDAKHEVAHVISRYHNEEFAYTLSDIDSFFLDWKILREVMLLKA